jgi:integrase
MRVNLAINGDYWRAEWTDDSGKRHKKSLGSRSELSKAQANRLCDEIARQHLLNPTARSVGSKSPTLAAWWKWWEQHEAVGLSAKTMDGYGKTKARTLAHFGETTQIDRIGRAAITAWRAAMQAEELATNTVRGNLMRFGAVLGSAVKLGTLPANPVDHEPRSMVKTDVPWRYLPTSEAEKLIDATARPEWQAAIALARFAGLRINEIRSLTWADVNLVHRTLTVRHEGAQTTKKRTRLVPITPRLAEILESVQHRLPAGEQSVAPIGGNNTYRQMEALRARAGIEPYGKPFHTLRKSCESDWLATLPAMDVCKWLGHDPTVAAAHYHTTLPETLARVTGAVPQVRPKAIDMSMERASQVPS